MKILKIIIIKKINKSLKYSNIVDYNIINKNFKIFHNPNIRGIVDEYQHYKLLLLNSFNINIINIILI